MDIVCEILMFIYVFFENENMVIRLFRELSESKKTY